MKSKRKDGRGHWPAGKRRHKHSGQWSRVRLGLARFLDAELVYGRISVRAVAAAVGVSDRTVRRWLRGVDRPDEATQDALAEWLREARAALKRSRPS